MTTTTQDQASAPSSASTSQSTNTDVPDHKFQINHDLLFEQEFERGAFVSAHLQRLQHGCFTDSNIHSKDTLHVTFAAITFTFHPVTSSGSSDYRFESAVIEISAKSSNQSLKFLKYAPHMAFGRISSASLKWHFKLGASVGVTNGPAKAELTPAADYEKDVVVGTMMKIQGSTRSTPAPLTKIKSPHRIPDTKLVWTLEENSQQKAGIPREFTFVFLMERPPPPPTTPPKEPKSLPMIHKRHSTVTASSSKGLVHGNFKEIVVEQSLEITSSTKGEKETPLAPHEGQPGHGIIDNLLSQATKMTNVLHPSQEEIPRYEEKLYDRTVHAQDADYDAIFKEIQFSVFVKPDIAGINIPKSLFDYNPQLSIVQGEVGQKLTAQSQGEGAEIDGLYNFARLPASFEDLIELPGNTTTTIEPTLPVK